MTASHLTRLVSYRTDKLPDEPLDCLRLKNPQKENLITMISKMFAVAVVCLALISCGGSTPFVPTAHAQTQTCSPALPAVSYVGSAVNVDMGTCVVFQGASDSFTFDTAYAPLYQDTFLSNPVTIQLNWTSPDSYSANFTVWVTDQSGNALSSPVVFSPSGSGTYTAPISLQFRPGMLLHIVEHLDVASADSQCFSQGYYCYFQAKFTLHN